MKKKRIVAVGIVSLMALAAAAYFIVMNKHREDEDAPPENAPQLPLSNPGDQSDFPAGPSGQPDLG